jgi:hypothetical protein
MMPNTYEFKSLNNLLDFVKPLIVEGYPVLLQLIPCKFPREYTIEKFVAYVGEKENQLEVYCKEETSNGNG